ncbi:DUF2911 domain-containing protein [Reichenbachiella ulvae]|uniref:DUF2911 domain-containing protein n=1 Tax=Reichenbachiella ulvae TaxID=2980104 RepID=A0ABT3CRH6_9BACT|nr:DUF2911 domain-containing protein [Reichenbachiella ulvae]MCV9386222.1 DUF2911 domain-containing protein [Reichenbachiella ulvae]
MKNGKIGWAVAAGLLVLVVGCHRAEYSQNYVSADSSDFEQYRKEASNRPSPPARATQNINGTQVYITYSQPGVKDRTIWGDLVKYDKIWRTGANEATVFSADKDIVVAGTSIPAGNYALYTIPSETEDWTVILNKKYDVWGAYDYDETQDVVRFKVPVMQAKESQERMVFKISDKGVVSFAWDYLRFEFPVKSK